MAVKLCVCPVCTDALAGETLTETGGGGAFTLMLAVEVLVASATDVAVSRIVAGLGAVVGAVYVTAAPDALELLDSVPQEAPVQPVPDSAQITPLSCESCLTVAVKS